MRAGRMAALLGAAVLGTGTWGCGNSSSGSGGGADVDFQIDFNPFVAGRPNYTGAELEFTTRSGTTTWRLGTTGNTLISKQDVDVGDEVTFRLTPVGGGAAITQACTVHQRAVDWGYADIKIPIDATGFGGAEIINCTCGWQAYMESPFAASCGP